MQNPAAGFDLEVDWFKVTILILELSTLYPTCEGKVFFFFFSPNPWLLVETDHLLRDVLQGDCLSFLSVAVIEIP